MESSPGGGNGGNVVPFPVINGFQVGVGSENQNAEEMFEPEMYDFSSLLDGDIADDVFPELIEMMKAGHVVPEMVAHRNMEQLVQPPPPPPTPPRHSKQTIILNPRDSGSIKWTKELHASFVDAVKHLGGAFIATPKTVLDIMDVEGLNVRQVKSHLQKYRRSRRVLNDWKKLYRRGSSFSRALGVPSKRVPSSQPTRPKKQCRRRAKPNKQEDESQQVKIMFQKHLQRLSEVQRQYAKAEASRMAVNQTMSGYTSAASQTIGGYPFAANQNSGGHVFSANQKMGGCALAGRKSYPENNFTSEATSTLMPRFPSYQLNQYNGCACTTTLAGMFTARKPDDLPSVPAAHSYQLTEASNLAKAASGSSQQGFNSDSGESSGAAGMSDEEFVQSFLVDYDELIGVSQDSQ